MKKLLPIIAIAAVGYFGYAQYQARIPEIAAVNSAPPISAEAAADIAQASPALASAFENRVSNIPVQGQGRVSKVLADDNDGSRHQRFLVRMSSGQTILVAHNIDLAPRITALSKNDVVEFSGVYEWNAKGGVVHWTHIDPAGHHQAGWLKHNGQTYQ